MTDWMSVSELTRDLLAAKYLCLLCLGAIIIDFAHSLRFDYHLLSRQEKDNKNCKIHWPRAFYFACKLLYIPYWTVTFVTGEVSYKLDCQMTILFSEVLMGLITCLCSALLGFRTLCVWQHRSGEFFKYFLLILWLGLLGAWMEGVRDVKGRWVNGIGSPWVKDQGACTFEPIPFRYAGKFVATVAFDTLVLLLTILGVVDAGIKTRLGSLLIEQGIIYVLLTVFANVLLVSFAWSGLNDVMTVIMSVPAQTISVMAATRLYVMLFQESQERHSPYKNSCSLPSFCDPNKLVPSGSSSSFPTYVLKGNVECDTMETMRDHPISLSCIGNSIKYEKANSTVIADRKHQLNSKKSQPLMKLNYNEGDPFGKRPKTSPASIQQQGSQCKNPTSVFIHETYSVISEPTPAHLKGHQYPHGQPFDQKKEQRPNTAAACSKS